MKRYFYMPEQNITIVVEMGVYPHSIIASTKELKKAISKSKVIELTKKEYEDKKIINNKWEWKKPINK